MIIQIVLEVLFGAALIVGFFHEDKIAQVEQKIFKKWNKKI
jgi:hypothetical protein